MASKQDIANRRAGSDESQMSYNQGIAEAQRDKTSFRAHKVAVNGDPYNPSRLDNAIQQKLIENG